jgi:hypothetical protein
MPVLTSFLADHSIRFSALHLTVREACVVLAAATMFVSTMRFGFGQQKDEPLGRLATMEPKK